MALGSIVINVHHYYFYSILPEYVSHLSKHFLHYDFVFSIFQKKSCWHFMDNNYVSGAICVYVCLHVCVLYNLYIHINILYVL